MLETRVYFVLYIFAIFHTCQQPSNEKTVMTLDYFLILLFNKWISAEDKLYVGVFCLCF